MRANYLNILLARHATRKPTTVELLVDAGASIFGQVRHLKVQRANVVHRTPRWISEYPGTKINYFQEQQRLLKQPLL